jgi:hypothetical protein
MRAGRKVLVATAAVLATVLGAGALEAQWTRVDDAWCEDSWGSSDQDRYCLAFEGEFDDLGRLELDGGPNGGVQIEGWNRPQVAVRAKVWGNARDLERAREIAEDVRVSMRDGRLRSDGPDTGRREGWGVTWEVMVPFETDLDVETMNGGIGVIDVRGTIDFRTTNGGVHLAGVGGDVRGRTTNGGLHVELDGRRWDGAGLDVSTTNGGVTIEVPADYSAELETGTVNGGFDLDFPLTVRGKIGRRLTTTLGEGGATVRAVTTNGGVRLVRGGNAIR